MKSSLLCASLISFSCLAEVPMLTATQTINIEMKSHIYFQELKVPYRGSLDSFTGKTNADPNLFKIAVYSFTLGEWYTKPWYNQPEVYIAQDGTFSFTVATGKVTEVSQSNVRVFVVPIDYAIPVSEGSKELPAELSENSVFTIHFNR